MSERINDKRPNTSAREEPHLGVPDLPRGHGGTLVWERKTRQAGSMREVPPPTPPRPAPPHPQHAVGPARDLTATP